MQPVFLGKNNDDITTGPNPAESRRDNPTRSAKPFHNLPSPLNNDPPRPNYSPLRGAKGLNRALSNIDSKTIAAVVRSETPLGRNSESKSDDRITPPSISQAANIAAQPKATRLEGTFAPEQIRLFFAAKPIGIEKDPKDPCDPPLYYLQLMGGALLATWNDPSIGLKKFEKLKRVFEEKVLPQFNNKIYQQQLLGFPVARDATIVPTDSNIPPEKSRITPQEIRCIFAATPIGLKDGQKESIDVFLYYLHRMGGALLATWNDPAKKGMNEFEVNKRNCENELTRVCHTIYQQEMLSIIPPIKAQIENAFLEEVEDLLKQKVFLDVEKLIDSLTNRDKLKQLLPETIEIFKHMELINKIYLQPAISGKKIFSSLGRTFKLKTLDLEIPDELGEDPLTQQYAFFLCACEICETYSRFLDGICKELKPQLLQGEPSSIDIVNEIMNCARKHVASPWAIMNSDPSISSKLLRDWITKKVYGIIKFRYLEVFNRGMRMNYRSLLVENIAVRPCMVSSFDQLCMNLEKKVICEKMETTFDVPRLFTNKEFENHVHFYANGIEVTAKNLNDLDGDNDNTKNLNGLKRFEALLETYSVLFDQPDIFLFLAEQLDFPTTKNQKNMETRYEEAYYQLMDLDDTEKSALEKKFESRYGPGIFEKALKYFKLSQHIFGQVILYYFNKNLLVTKLQKFKTNLLGMVGAQGGPDFKKNEFIINVNGSKCEIKIIRFDGLLNAAVHLRQEYLISFDVKEDRFNSPCKDSVHLSIECPSYLAQENLEIRTMLFELGLVNDSWGLSPLKINYTK